MRALILNKAPNRTFQIETIPLAPLKAGQARVRLLAASLNHRDQYIREGLYPAIQLPCVLGSDGCGRVEAVHDSDDRHWLDQEVIINPHSNFSLTANSPDYAILGMPENGTFAEYVTVAADRLHRKPAHLSAEQAAALPLAGLTAYRAMVVQGQLNPDMTILVTGAGGGVAQFAFQIARALGATVYVTSGDDGKLERARELGAAGGINYRLKRWERRLKRQSGDFDLIVDGAGGDQINALLRILRPGGKLVIYGKTTGDPTSLQLFRIFWNHLTIQGTTMGTDEDFAALIKLYEEKRLAPIIDSVRPFEEIVTAFDRMKEGKQLGKLVVRF